MADNVKNSVNSEVNAVSNINVKNEVKDQVKQIKDATQLDELVATIKKVDTIIVAGVLVGVILIANKKKYMESSEEAFASQIPCNVELPTPVDVEVEFIPLDVQPVCPIETDDVVVPHEPFSVKSEPDRVLSCDVDQAVVEEKVDKSGIASKAIIESTSANQFSIKVDVSSMVTASTLLGTLGASTIYSPVQGIVTNIRGNRIYIGDISDPDETTVEKSVAELQRLYDEMDTVKLILREFSTSLMLPIMVGMTTNIDPSAGKPASLTVGIQKSYDKLKAIEKTARATFDKGVKTITGKDNVEKNAKNESLNSIKDGLAGLEKELYTTLHYIYNYGSSIARASVALSAELYMLDHYVILYRLVVDSASDKDDVKSLMTKLNECIIDRYFIEKWSVKGLMDKLNNQVVEILEKYTNKKITVKIAGKTIAPDIVGKMVEIYTQKKSFKSVEVYLDSAIKEFNSKMTQAEREMAIEKVMVVFTLLVDITQKQSSGYTNKSKIERTALNDSLYFRDYISSLWKKYMTLQKSIDDLLKVISEPSVQLNAYSVVEEDDEQYRYYGVSDDPCPSTKDEEGYLSPKSKYGYGDIQYWMKYCSMATLVGVTNPASWSTGLPPPAGPTPFPVVYIPIKAIETKWGFIVIGMTITGIYIFPFVLYGNLSTGYQVPVPSMDPTKAIKSSIDDLKRTVTFNFKAYKNSMLKTYLKQQKERVDSLTKQVNDAKDDKREHKLKKPKRIKGEKFGKVKHAQRLAEWTAKQTKYTSSIAELEVARFKEESLYRIVYKAFNGAKIENFPDKAVKQLKDYEKKILEQLDNIKELADSIDPILQAIPIALTPGSACFLATVKNPTPLILIANRFNENINQGALKPIMQKFKVKADDLMSPKSKFSQKLGLSYSNWDDFKDALKMGTLAIVQRDPFPKYENLKLSNVPYIAFLFTSFTPTGGQTYGIPGFPPVPVPKTPI